MAGPLWLAAAASQAALQRGMPTSETDPAEALDWFKENRRRFLTGQVIGGLGFGLCYLPFLGTVIEESRGSSAARAWSTAALGAGLLSPAAGTAGGALLMGLAKTSGKQSGVATAAEISAGLGAAEYAFNVSGVLLGLVPAFVVMSRSAIGTASKGSMIGPLAIATCGAIGAAGQLDTVFSKQLTTIGSLTWPGVMAWILNESWTKLR